MTRTYSKSLIEAYSSALARASMPPELKTFAAAFDDLREVVAKADLSFDKVRLAPPPMTTSPVITLKANLDKLSRDLRRLTQFTCDGCCHYQAHPPRCQLSKRSISPNQFSCKKYSPKHNPRK